MAFKITFLLVSCLLLQIVQSRPFTEYEQCNEEGECSLVDQYGHDVNLKIEDHRFKPTPQQLCEACDIIMPLARMFIDSNTTSTDLFEKVASLVCIVLKIEDDPVCVLAIKSYAPIVLNVIKNSPLSDNELCDIGLGCGVVTNPILDWNITLPNVPKPPVVPPVPPKPDSPKIRVLHLSDIHIDFEYQPGAIADCADPLCCRNQSTPTEHYSLLNSSGAGYWGDYRSCDVPFWTVENMFQFISKNEDFDFIYWTGDLPPHNVWNQTKGDQLHAIDQLSKLFLKYFPNKVIYPTLGNHEAAPCNIYPTPYVKDDSIDWLYSAIAKNWTATGLPEYLSQNISQFGFYSIPIGKGIRLVSMNMNYCPGENFYLYINATDPQGHLEWLANVLQASENNGEKVHIIGHIPPESCLESWSATYNAIVERYESTIAAQFFGHTHKDHFKLFYDSKNNSRAVSISYIGPSTTTFSYINPGYKIYTIDGFYDGTSARVLDYEVRILNITDANLSKEPIWQKEYSAKDAFGMDTLFPQDWNSLIDRALKDLDGPIFNKLYRYYYKLSDAIDYNGCNDACKKSFLCDYKQSSSAHHIPC